MSYFFSTIERNTCVCKLTQLYQARRSRSALADFPLFLQSFLYQLLQSKLLVLLSVSQSYPISQGDRCGFVLQVHGTGQNPTHLWEALCCGNITIFIYAIAFQTCFTTLLSRSVHHVSRSNRDINSVATLDSVFSSVTKREWYVPSFPVLACSWGGRERYMTSKYQLEKRTSLQITAKVNGFGLMSKRGQYTP